MNNKLSYYTIFSDDVNQRGDKILLCTRTGEAFIVNQEVQSHLLNNNLDALPESVIERIENAKGIVDFDEDELLSIRDENKASISDSNELYMVIQPSANCQLGCYYCGQSHTKTYLSESLFPSLLERIETKATQSKCTSLWMGWFGGEPLMALPQIRKLTPRIKKIADEHNMSYGASITTNGLSLKPGIYRELAKELGVRKIEITLDGTAEFHDKHRYTKEGGSSFDLIFKNLVGIVNMDDFADLNCPISVRCNVDSTNIDGVSSLISFLAEHNLQNKIAYFYPIGIYSWGGNEAHKKSMKKEEYAKKEIDWFIEMFENGFTPNIIPRRQKQVCMAVSANSEMFDAYGNVFNCTEVSLTDFYENTPYALGNLKKPEEISTNRPLSDWNDTILTDKFPCHTCKMLPLCGGACPKSWHEDMRACPSFKFNIKERLALGYVLSKSDIKDLV